MARWIEGQGLSKADCLFPGRSGSDKPLSDSQFRRDVKGLAVFLGLNPAFYGCHSLRRTKPVFMHDDFVSPAVLKFLLGHQSLQSTQEYLGVDQKQALAKAREYDIFAFGPAVLAKAQGKEQSPSLNNPYDLHSLMEVSCA